MLRNPPSSAEKAARVCTGATTNSLSDCLQCVPIATHSRAERLELRHRRHVPPGRTDALYPLRRVVLHRLVPLVQATIGIAVHGIVVVTVLLNCVVVSLFLRTQDHRPDIKVLSQPALVSDQHGVVGLPCVVYCRYTGTRRTAGGGEHHDAVFGGLDPVPEPGPECIRSLISLSR